MLKKALLSIVAIFVTWSALDFIIHGLILGSTYEATASLWRPMEEMNMGLMYGVSVVYAACFVAIYGLLITDKSVMTGLKYGALFGLASGITTGFGSYTYLPIPLILAVVWFAGALVSATLAGIIAGAIMKDR